MRNEIISAVAKTAVVAFIFSSTVNYGFAGDKAKNLGAKKPPVKVSPTVKALNDEYIAVSQAVLPTIASIAVTTEKKQNMRSMSDMQDFFKFFGSPFGNQQSPDEEEETPNNNKKNNKDKDEDDMPSQSGSGVFISADGYIVTNNHVVEGAKENGIKVTTYDNKEHKAKLIGRDPLTDLALIKIEGDGFTPAFIGNSDSIKVGEIVFAVGNPMGLNYTVTNGIVSAIGRGGLGLMTAKDRYAVENFIQTDAAINPGNSGGGLFDIEGKLVGINSAIATQTGTFMGYGFAIPANMMQSVISDLMENGKINRGYIGVEIKKLDETDAKAAKLDNVKGVFVASVQKGKAGDKAGIEAGDIIIELDGKEVKSNNDLQAMLVQHHAGDVIKVGVWRNGEKIIKKVELESREGDDVAETKTAKKGGDDNSDNDELKNYNCEKLGFTAEALSSDVKKSLDIDEGAMITKIKPKAAKRGITAGGVIIKADGKTVKNPGQLKKNN